MKKFLFSLILGIFLAGGAATYLYFNADRFGQGTILRKSGEALKPDVPEIQAQPPQDYHLLQDLGGVPFEQAEKAGLATQTHAYLAALDPIAISEGITVSRGVKLRGNNYDFCYSFSTEWETKEQLEFNLNGAWDELHFGFGFDDTQATDPNGRGSEKFTLYADGVELFGPQEFKPEDKPYFAMYDVSGVNRLSFVVQLSHIRPKYCPTLFDPFVLKTEK